MERWWWVPLAVLLVVTAVWWRQSRVARLRDGIEPGFDRKGRR